MFTGIVAAVGRIRALEPIGDGTGRRVRVAAGTLDLSDVAIGDSIAIQGACMTVIHHDMVTFDVEVSAESLARTIGLDRVGEVNLEKAMRLADRVGGHLVSGHVDGVGRIVAFDAVGESHRLVVAAPRTLARYLAVKGSITVDGVSLTVNAVEDTADDCRFTVNLIPHTVAVTTLGRRVPGDPVNLEIDQVARYLERMREVDTTGRA